MNSVGERRYKIFIDFDGTITKKDVGENLFIHFGDAKEANSIISLWMEGKISSLQSWELLCNTINGFNPENFESFLDTIEVDDHFVNFVEYCRQNEIEIKILSDGLDYYIEKILSRNNLLHLSYFSNKLEFGSDNTLIPKFPFTDEECDICANCKRNHILNFSSDDDFTIYIGDGYSDKCPAQFCDFIFAKNTLLKYCEKNRITYFPYRSFYEVQKKVDELRKKKKLRKKIRAELKRKEVYIQG